MLGGAGFIGSAVTRELLSRGCSVSVYDDLSSGKEEFVSDLALTALYKRDILSDDELHPLVRAHDCIIDLIALPYIPECYTKPKEFLAVNASHIINVMLALRGLDKKFLYVSSSEVYGSAQSVPMDELHPLHPQSTYAVTKLAAEQLVYTMAIEHNIQVVIARQFNCYGPRETHPYVIPEIIFQAVSPYGVNPEFVLGNLAAGRDFVYVEDAARALCDLLFADISRGEIVNVGTGRTFRVWEVAEEVLKAAGSDSKPKYTQDDSRLRPFDVKWLESNNTKLQRLTGWVPRVRFPEGIKQTIDFYVKNGHKWSFQ